MAYGTLKVDAIQGTNRTLGVDQIVGLDPAQPPASGETVFWDGSEWVASGIPPSDLSYNTGTRFLDSSTGSGVTLPLFASGTAGFVPAASGGTSAFLREDGQWSSAVTNVGLQVPSGLVVSGSPITTSGSFVVAYASGIQAFTTAESTKLAGVASGATANTGTVESIALSVPSGLVVSGSPITVSGEIVISYASGIQAFTTAESLKLSSIASGAEVNVGTNLSYSGGSRTINSSTGSGTVLPLFASGLAGLVPSASGGTTSFLREDGTWQEVVGATDLSYDTGTRVLDSSTGSGVTLPIFASGIAGFVPASSGGTSSFLREDGTWATVSGGAGVTDLSYDAATRVIDSSTGSGATLPIFASGTAGLVPAASGGTTLFLREDGEWSSAGAAAAGTASGLIQYNDGGSPAGLAASSGLSWDDVDKELLVGGDINLDDGGSFTTTVQCVTPTANRTISFPDATGTVGLVAGSSGQFVYNNAGAYAGVSTMTFDGTSVTLTGRLINSYNSASLAPAKVFTGTWITGQSATNNKPHFLIEPTGSTSTAWNTNGTALGVNASSVTFAGLLLDLQANASSRFSVSGLGRATLGSTAASGASLTTTAPAWLFTGAGTYTDTASAGTTTHGAIIAIDNPAIAGTNARTYTNASTLYIDGAPTAGANITITNGYSFFVNAGASYFGGNLQLAAGSNIVAATTGSGTRIGTAVDQLIGFFNKTPVVQPASANQAALTNSTGGTADGTLSAVGNTTTDQSAVINNNFTELHVLLNEVRTALVNLGLIKGAA